MHNFKKCIRLRCVKAEKSLKTAAKAHVRYLRDLARWGHWGICLIPLSLFAQTQHPNIVLIFADDIGYEAVSPGNEEYDTPNLDRLSDAGIRFDNAFSNAVCTPSRVKIMTGMSNVRNYTGFGDIDIDQTTFAHQLKSVGYATVIAGKWQLGVNQDKPQILGFDQSLLWQHTRPRTREGGHDTRYPNPRLERNGIGRSFEEVDYNNGEYGPEVLTSFIIDFIEEQANRDTPFLAYYTMNLPHCPFSPTPDSPDWDPTSPGSPDYFGIGDNEQWNHHFGEMVTYADKMVGRIESKLIELGIRENTLIIFIGDNGTDKPITTDWKGLQIKGGKRSLNDQGLRVPFIANWPGTIPPKSVSDRLVDLSDILPTLCDMTGAPLPEGRVIDGYSLLPEMKGENSPNREFVYIYYPEGHDHKENILARTEEYMLRRLSDNTTDGTLYHFPEQYTMNEIPTAEMTEDEVTLKSEMLALISRMGAEKGSEIGPAKVPEAELPVSRERATERTARRSDEKGRMMKHQRLLEKLRRTDGEVATALIRWMVGLVFLSEGIQKWI